MPSDAKPTEGAELAEAKRELAEVEAEYRATMERTAAAAEAFDRKAAEFDAAVVEMKARDAAHEEQRRESNAWFERTMAEVEAHHREIERELVEMKAGRAYSDEQLALIQAGPDESRAATARALAELRAAYEAASVKEQQRTGHATYHLTRAQRDMIKELSLVLKLDDSEELGSVGESEILRGAVELFMSMPGAMQLSWLRDNREKEKGAGMGFWWQRKADGK